MGFPLGPPGLGAPKPRVGKQRGNHGVYRLIRSPRGAASGGKGWPQICFGGAGIFSEFAEWCCLGRRGLGFFFGGTFFFGGFFFKGFIPPGLPFWKLPPTGEPPRAPSTQKKFFKNGARSSNIVRWFFRESQNVGVPRLPGVNRSSHPCWKNSPFSPGPTPIGKTPRPTGGKGGDPGRGWGQGKLTKVTIWGGAPFPGIKPPEKPKFLGPIVGENQRGAQGWAPLFNPDGGKISGFMGASGHPLKKGPPPRGLPPGPFPKTAPNPPPKNRENPDSPSHPNPNSGNWQNKGKKDQKN